ncbi:DUF4352 domain-containing protein [Sporosarcina sp. BI001-red]|uniref:DUF4352 domain-containing protein n=1 Tax=Sporosarcina sp. BI001-red TaxID=2282866 RepID=UPI000E27C9A6|nr:DUF4352 domain-containing protein [Sporosarcina sp. BI001-red]REB08554.1 DUF4352 domain-containing protein [Sporosarcina sp. BI001-red]
MKKVLFSLLMGSLLLLGACSEEGDSSKEKETVSDQKSKGTVDAKDFNKMYTNPDKYKNYQVSFTGRVFTDPERDDNGIYLQVWADPKNGEKNILVGYSDSDLEVNMDDYISVEGVVEKTFEGENAFGAKVVAPVIKASKVEVLDYMAAVAPTLKTIEVNQDINQHGFIVHVDKVELAENETRVYVKAKNESKDNVSLFSSSTKLIVGSKQMEEDMNYEADYPELQSDLIPETETEGIITFGKIDETEKTLKFYAEGYSDDYELDIDPFVFTIQND